MSVHNCNTLRRFGPPRGGIQISTVMGKGEGVSAGRFHVARDKFHGCDVDTSGTTPTVYCATIREQNGNRTLSKPKLRALKEVYIKVYFGQSVGGTEHTHNWHVSPYSAVVGTGTVIAQQGQEAFLEIGHEQAMSFMFPDGHIRTFRNFNGVLAEVFHTNEVILEMRIKNAFERIERAREEDYKDGRFLRVCEVLRDMTDLLLCPICMMGGRRMRMRLIHDFFYDLTYKEFDLARDRLWEMLVYVDRSLIPFLTRDAFNYAYRGNASTGAKVLRFRKRG